VASSAENSHDISGKKRDQGLSQRGMNTPLHGAGTWPERDGHPAGSAATAATETAPTHRRPAASPEGQADPPIVGSVGKCWCFHTGSGPTRSTNRAHVSKASRPMVGRNKRPPTRINRSDRRAMRW